MFVDSHCHLNFPELRQQLPEIRRQMQDAGVLRALCISVTLETFPDVLELAQSYDNFWATVGVHPDYDEGIKEPTFDDLIELGSLDRVVGIGETGLDYYRLEGRSIADMEWQRERFRNHIRAARHLNKPLVIHTRESARDTLDIMKAEQAQDPSGVFHCFTESEEVAREALDLGFYISFSGIVTFKNAKALHEVAKFVPLDRCLIETDSPYLAPTPHRGKTNTPAYVPFVAQYLAELKSISVEEVGETTSRNFERLFKLPVLELA